MKTDTTTTVMMAGREPLNVLTHRTKLHNFATWEQEYVSALLDYITPHHVVYDIGAEQGEFTAMVSKIVGGPNVHIFEPSARMWPNIKAVWNANCPTNPAATFAGFVGDVVTDNAVVTKYGWPDCVNADLTDESAFGHFVQHPHIQRVSLDWYAKRHAPPAVIMCDVEGCECVVVRGAMQLFKELGPTVFMSIHRPEQLADYGGSQSDIFVAMRSIGYRDKLIHADHEEHWMFEK